MKNKFLHYAPFLILPVLLAITAVYLNNARGPFWLGANHDPEYVYLLNSLNLAQGGEIGHIDHPGTPVQMLGAVTIRVVHAVNAPADIDLQTDVLKRPEFYLNAIDAVLVTLNALMLLALGFFAYRYTLSIWISLWLQAAPFLSITALNFGLTRVNPEPLLFFCSLAMTLLLVKWLQIRSQFDIGGAPSAYSGPYSGLVILLGLVTGLGIAVKITFFPLIMAPLFFLPQLKNKAIFLITSLAGFVVFTLPIAGSYPKFFDWIYRILTRKGLYGSRGKGMIPFDQWLGNVKTILLDNPFFTFVLVLAAISIVVVLLIPKLRKIAVSGITFKTLTAVFLGQLLGVAMVAKHSLSRYLLPVLMLSGILLVIQLIFFQELLERFYFKEKIKKNSPAIIFAVIVIGAFIMINPPLQINKRAGNKARNRDKALQQRQTIENDYKGFARVYWFGSSSKPQALNFGNNLAHHLYSNKLTQMYPDDYFYDFIKKQFYGFHHSPPVPIGMIRAKHKNKVLFHGHRRQKFPGLNLKRIDTGRSKENIFLLEPEDTVMMESLTRWTQENISKGTVLVIPAGLAGSVPALQQDYRIVFENYKQFRDLRFYRMTALLGQPYFLVPAPPYPGKGSPTDFLSQFRADAVFPENGPPELAMGRPTSIPGELSQHIRFIEIKVWHSRKKNNVSPSLHAFKTNGTVTLDFIRIENRNTLKITAGDPGGKGEHVSWIGYRFNKRGLKAQLPAGKTIYLVITVKFPAHLRNSENFLFIDDLRNFWKRKKLHFPGTGWMTCVLFKNIPAKSKDLRLGMQFTPQSPGDEVLIRDIKVYVSQ